MEVRPSRVRGAGQGLFATVDIPLVIDGKVVMQETVHET